MKLELSKKCLGCSSTIILEEEDMAKRVICDGGNEIIRCPLCGTKVIVLKGKLKHA